MNTEINTIIIRNIMLGGDIWRGYELGGINSNSSVNVTFTRMDYATLSNTLVMHII